MLKYFLTNSQLNVFEIKSKEHTRRKLNVSPHLTVSISGPLFGQTAPTHLHSLEVTTQIGKTYKVCI